MANIESSELEESVIGDIKLNQVCGCVSGDEFDGEIHFSTYDDCRRCGGSGLELTDDGRVLLTFLKKNLFKTE